MKVTKKEALNSKGKLKKGYYYDWDGQLRKAQPTIRTKFYKFASLLGSLGGKAKARNKKNRSA